MPFINNKRWGYIPSGINALNNSNLFLIAWLNKLRLSMFFKTYNNFYRPNNAYLETCFIKVVYIIVLNTILNFSFLNKLKPYTNHLKIFLEYFLIVFYLIKSHFKLI